MSSISRTNSTRKIKVELTNLFGVKVSGAKIGTGKPTTVGIVKPRKVEVE